MKNLIFLKNFCDKTKISFVNVKDIKGFGKKFTDDEVKKFLDPYGFLSPNQCT
jgi:hypothetical protein